MPAPRPSRRAEKKLFFIKQPFRTAAVVRVFNMVGLTFGDDQPAGFLGYEP